MLRRGQPDSGEGCIVLQSGPTRSFVAKFRSVWSSLAVHEFRAAKEEHCKPGHDEVRIMTKLSLHWAAIQFP